MSMSHHSLSGDEMKSSMEQKGEGRQSGTYEVSPKDYFIFKPIGSGATATAYLGIYQHQTVVIKHYDKPKPQPYPSPDVIAKSEFTSLKACFPTKYIIKPIAYSFNPPVVLLEYAENGSLLDLLLRQDLTWNQRIQIASDVAFGLIDLKKNNYVHRDIKSNNVLITDDFHGKLTDFDLVCHVDVLHQNKSCSLKVGTYPYLAPECLNYNYPYLPYAADVFSFGVLLIELGVSPVMFEEYVTSDEEYHTRTLLNYEIRTLARKKQNSSFFDSKSVNTESDVDMVEALVAEKRYASLVTMMNNPVSMQWPSGYKALVKECISLDPSMRPTIDEVAKRLDEILNPKQEVTEKQTISLKDKPHLWSASAKAPLIREVAEHQAICIPRCVIL